MPQEDTGLLPRRATERFVELTRLGEGGMGVAYRARDRTLGRDVALKLLRPELLENDELRKRFKREVRALSQLVHPNIVCVFEFHDEEETPFFSMEYVDGQPLSALFAGELRDPSRIVALFRDLAGALAAIHEQDIVHRDIKPENIMVSREGVAKFVDFGLAKRTGDREQTALTKTNQVVGTLCYLPPEVLRGSDYDRRSDIYQLGLTLYYALTGVHPMAGPALAALVGGADVVSVAPPSTHNEACDEALDALVLQAMALDPARRPASALDLGTRLTAWCKKPRPKVRKAPPTARAIHTKQPATLPARTLPRPRSRRRLAVMALAALAAVATPALLYLQEETPPAVYEEPGILSVLSNPGDAIVEIADTVVPKGPGDGVELQPGYHTIRATHEGYEPATIQFLVRSGRKSCALLSLALEGPDGTEAFERAQLLAANDHWTEAVALYRRAADSHHTGAQVELGLCYEHGRGVDSDAKEAYEWFRKAESMGDVAGILHVSRCLEEGVGVERDHSFSLINLRKAAEYGHREAFLKVAQGFHTGEIFKRDLTEAAFWYRLAASDGNEEAVEALEELKANE